MHVRALSRTIAAGFTLLVASALVTLPPNSVTRAAEDKPDAAPAPSSPSTLKTATNPVTRAAVDAGVLTCASRINQVSNYLTANNQSGVYIFVPQGDRDRRLFSASFEILTSNSSTLYATASFAPNQENGSGAVYDTVEYVDKTCDELAKTVFKDLKRVGVLKKNITVLDGGAVKVFLMPAGTGCVVIRKELVQ